MDAFRALIEKARERLNSLEHLGHGDTYQAQKLRQGIYAGTTVLPQWESGQIDGKPLRDKRYEVYWAFGEGGLYD